MESQKALSSKEAKEIKKILEENYGYKHKLDYQFFMNEKEKIFIINREISNVNLVDIKINSIGLYFGQWTKGLLRLSVEGSQIVGPESNNVLSIDGKQVSDWINGKDIDLEKDQEANIKYPFIIIKSNNDYLGSGKI